MKVLTSFDSIWMKYSLVFFSLILVLFSCRRNKNTLKHKYRTIKQKRLSRCEATLQNFKNPRPLNFANGFQVISIVKDIFISCLSVLKFPTKYRIKFVYSNLISCLIVEKPFWQCIEDKFETMQGEVYDMVCQTKICFYLINISMHIF